MKNVGRQEESTSIPFAVKSIKDWGEGEMANSHVLARDTVEGRETKDEGKRERRKTKDEEKGERTKDSKEEEWRREKE